MKNTVIYPEMGQETKAELQYKCSHDGKFIVKTNLELKGRGITLENTGNSIAKTKYRYLITANAMEKLKQKYSYCYIAAL